MATEVAVMPSSDRFASLEDAELRRQRVAVAARVRREMRFEGHLHRGASGGSGFESVGAIGASVKQIATGGMRSLRTARCAAVMGLAHRTFQSDLKAMMDIGAPEDLVERACSEYLTSAATVFRDHVLAEGGFQIKVGQMICMQKAILPREITETLTPCCDGAPCAAFSSLREVVRERLGVGALDEVFSRVDASPLGSASIAQVHRATLRADWVLDRTFDDEAASRDRDASVRFLEVPQDLEVVVKIQHAGVAEFMRSDVAFLPYLARMVSALEPDHGMESFMTLVEDMLAQEVDFRVEGHNRERLAAILKRSGFDERSEHASVRLPKVHWALTRPGVIVQDYAGTSAPLSDRAAVEQLGVPFALAVSELSTVFAECVFVHGYTHNDLHGGNVLVQPYSAASDSFVRRHRDALATACLTLAYACGACTCLWALVRAWTLAAALCEALFYGASEALALPPLARTILVAMLVGVALSKGPAPETLRDGTLGSGVGVAALAYGSHLRASQAVQRHLCRGDTFRLVLIDHGFHTDVPEAFRVTFCKAWAAVGLRDATKLAEAAYELGLSSDPACLGEGVCIPLVLCLLPYDDWEKGVFPTPGGLIDAVKDPQTGLRRLRKANAKLPKVMHVLMRANRQILALYQMQLGLTPHMRHEFMKTMTKHALIGLAFDGRLDALPDPDNLTTADAAFFRKHARLADLTLERKFKWKFPKLVSTISTGHIFKSGLARMAAGAASGSEPPTSPAPIASARELPGSPR